MSIRHKLMLIVQALTLSACAPISANLPPQLTETATPLARGEIRGTLALGGGGTGLDGSAYGGDARVRVGVGQRQELGLEGVLLRVDTGTPNHDSPPWIGKSLSYGMKLSWKLAPVDWFAIIAGAGAMSAATGESAGGDLAIVFSRPVGFWRPYAGLRGTFATPIARASDDRGGFTGGVVVPGGMCLHVSNRVEVFIEGGYVEVWATGESELPSMENPNPQDQTTDHPGGYAVVGLSFTLAP